MVRVPGSSGDSGFHRESQEEVKVKIEQGDQASSDLGSTTTPLNEARPADRQSAGRNSIDGKEADPDPDLEDKPQPPPQVPSGTPVGLESHRDPLTKQTKAGQNRYAFADSPVKLSPRDPTLPLMFRWEWEAKVPAKWTALKAPDLEEEPKEGQVPAGIKTETSTPTWNEADLEFRYYRKELQKFMTHSPIMRILQPTQIGDQTGPVTAPATADNKLEAIKILMNLLQEAGLVAGAFDADDLFRPDLRIFQLSTKELFDKLKVIVGEKVTDPSTTLSPDSPTQIGSTGDRTSSPFVSAAEADSDASSEPRRMSLGPAGAAMLQARAKASRRTPARSKAKKPPGAVSKPKTSPPHLVITTDNATTSTDKMESYFQAAMSRFLREQQISMPNLAARTLPNPGTRDVEMESAGSDDLERLQWEYDPDDLDLPTAAPAAVAPAAVGSSESTLIQRVRISAISDLKEFTGKDQDEDRARAWICKVKSSFMRDQASSEEKCLTLADLLSGPAKNWYRQLPRSTRNKWSDLLRSFRIQYCGFGVSVVHQYYQTHKRPDESALEYLYRLNVAGLRARLKIKDGGSKERREHVVHFIDTLGDDDLADQLTLLRLPDVDELEAVLRALDRAKNRRKTSALESDNCPPKGLPTPPHAPAEYVRAIKIPATGSEYDSEGDGSVFDEDYPRRVYLAAGNKQPLTASRNKNVPDRSQPDRHSPNQAPCDHRSKTQADRPDHSHCSNCGSGKHTDLGCWRRLTCQKCGKEGHPTYKCLFVCRSCEELHDIGKCPRAEFYHQIRRWFDPAKHAGMLPAMAEKMLRSPGCNPVRAERSRYCIYAFVSKPSADQASERPGLRGSTFDQQGKRATVVSSLCQVDDFARFDTTEAVDLDHGVPQGYWKQQDPDRWFKPVEEEDAPPVTQSRRVAAYGRPGDPVSPDLLPGEYRGYWKRYSPGKWFRQAKITGKINDEKATLLIDTGAELSIVDTAFARKVGCYIDKSQSQDCVGIADNVYTTKGRTRIKITLAGSLVYFFDIWVGDLSGQDAILGMDFLVPAGIRLDLADGSLCLPEEIRIHLSGRRQLYNDKARLVRLEQHLQLEIGESVELPLRVRTSDQDKLWVTRGELWVPTAVYGPSKTLYLQITNVGEKKLVMQRDERIGMWLAGNRVPRPQGFVSVGSRRYMEWQNLALQATTDARSTDANSPEVPPVPMVERTKYYVPRAILRKRDQVYNQQVEGRSHFSEGGQNGQPSDRRDLTTVRDKTTTTTKTRHVRALQVATTPDQMQQNSLRASRNPDAPANGSLDQSPSNTNLLGDSDMSPPTDPEYSRLATWHDGSARHKYAQITPTEPIPPCAEYSRSDRTAESQDQRTGRDHGRDHGRDPSRILCLVSAHATEAADRVSTDDATPDPGSCRSLGQEDVLTRQDPTSDTQGDGDSSDLYDLGQANQPVVTSGGNQGGNQLETWCGSAESTYGGVERNLDLAVSHVSTDDATPDPSSCRSLGQEDVLTRQDPTSDTEGDGDSSDLYDLGQANQPVVTSGGNQGGNQLETWCGSAESTCGGVERDLDPAVSHDLVGDELGRSVPLDYKKRQGSDQTSGQVASSDDSSADRVVDKQVCCPDSGDLRAEDVEAKMVVLPEVMSATEEITFNDIHAGDPTINTAGQIGHLQLIWRNQYVTIDNGRTLPLAARGIASDVNEGVPRVGTRSWGRSLPVSRPNPK